MPISRPLLTTRRRPRFLNPMFQRGQQESKQKFCNLVPKAVFFICLVPAIIYFNLNLWLTKPTSQLSVRTHANTATTTNTTTTGTTTKKRRNPASLRYDWTNMPPMTPLGKLIQKSQTRCFDRNSKPQSVFSHSMIPSGMGSMLHTWSQGMCHAAEHDQVLVTVGHFLWNDRSKCAEYTNRPLSCYFGSHTETASRCPVGTLSNYPVPRNQLMADRESGNRKCEKLTKEFGLSGVRAGTTEWLFQNVSSIVLEEVERQITSVFNGILPPSEDLVTVHMRWGDKWREVPQASAESYVNYTKLLLTPEELSGSKRASILLVTEDPTALEAFQKLIPKTWDVYTPGPKLVVGGSRSSMMGLASTTGGSAGLESLASLLIAMEANRYMISTGSNWSRLINELRKNVIDPRCGNCTRYVDMYEVMYGYYEV